jgi:uncharacterized protein with PIN domain
MIGYDTASMASHVASDILDIALDENRTILTRNSGLADMKLARDVILLTDDDPWEQLREVIRVRHLPIERTRVLTRCLIDNNVLVPISREDVRDKVWPYVYATQEKFTICPACGRVYWPATHVEAMLAKLKQTGLIS